MFLEKLNGVLSSKKSFISDQLNLAGFGLSALINIIHWLVLYSKIRPGSDNILLHYNVISGPDTINKSVYAFMIPLFALVILILNLWVASVFYKNEKLSAYFLALSSIAIQIIFFVASIVLIVANNG